MKPIHKMTNVDKAKLLHGLFPKEIPALLQFVASVCHSIRENERSERTTGNHAVISFECWLNLLNDTERRIDRYGEQLHLSASLFADQLFDGQTSLFMQYCLRLYVETRQHSNQDFTRMVRLLFQTDRD